MVWKLLIWGSQLCWNNSLGSKSYVTAGLKQFPYLNEFLIYSVTLITEVFLLKLPGDVKYKKLSNFSHENTEMFKLFPKSVIAPYPSTSLSTTRKLVFDLKGVREVRSYQSNEMTKIFIQNSPHCAMQNIEQRSG